MRALWSQAEGAGVPAGCWARWGSTLAVGFVVTALFTAGLTHAARLAEDEWLASWDRSLLMAIAASEHLSFVDAMVLQSPGNFTYLVPVTALTAVVAVRWSRPLVAASMIACYVLARAFVYLGWGLWDRMRPETIAEGVAVPGLNSFPSGHATFSAAAYGFLAYLWCRVTTSRGERALALLLLAVWLGLVNVSRLRVGAHWPSDVAAGLLIGGVWLGWVVMALRRSEPTTHFQGSARKGSSGGWQ